MKFRKRQMPESESLRHDQAQIAAAHTNFYMREAYKSLRTNVVFSLTEENKCQVVMVTSSMPGEGKSMTSVNLAIALAEADYKTLLVDCDMRKPKVARLLRIKNNVGLSDALFDEKKCEFALNEIKNLKLSVMTAGRIPPNPSELLGSERMGKLLGRMKEQFDFIILDTPPINVVTDAAIVGSLTNGALVVVRAGMAERNALNLALEKLKISGAKLLGLVMNGVEMQSQSHGKYGKYKKYGYGYEELGASEEVGGK